MAELDELLVVELELLLVCVELDDDVELEVVLEDVELDELLEPPLKSINTPILVNVIVVPPAPTATCVLISSVAINVSVFTASSKYPVAPAPIDSNPLPLPPFFLTRTVVVALTPFCIINASKLELTNATPGANLVYASTVRALIILPHIIG